MSEIIEVIETINYPSYKVYASINSNKQVEKIFSTCFEEPKEEDILIKEGYGDEYVHVGYYQIYDDRACHKYKIIEGELIETTEEEKELEFQERESSIVRQPTEIEILQQQIADLEIELISNK